MKITVSAIFLLAGLLAFSAIASEQVISEKSFSDSGYSALAVSEADTEKCAEYQFLKDMNQNSAEYYTVASLHAEFSPVASRDAKAAVYLAKSGSTEFILVKQASSADFRQNWMRVELPKESLSGQNTLKVCLKTSFSTSNASLLADSMIGTYKMADFSGTNSIVQSVSSREPVVGEQVTVDIKVTNTGSEGTLAKIYYWDVPMLESAMKVVGGQTEKEEFLEAGQSTTMTYYIKPKRPIEMSLPSAIVSYTNVFGEKQTVLSNYENLKVKQPPFLVSATILPDSETNKTGKNVPISIAVKNNGTTTVYNVAVELFAKPNGLKLSGASQTILELEPKEVKLIQAEASSDFEASYELGCKLVYLENTEAKGECAPQKVSFNNPSIGIIVGAMAALIVVSTIIYVFINSR
ncbi:MAG: BatD family protein [archaeon]